MNHMADRDVKSAAELKEELDWAMAVLLGAGSRDRVEFHEPIAAPDDAVSFCNWDVTVCCSPDDDEIVRTAITHVAERWNLA